MKNLLNRLKWEVLSRVKLDVTVLSGREKHTGAPLTVAYASFMSEPRNYFSRLLFEGAPEERPLGSQWTKNIEALIRLEAPEAALLVCEADKRRQKFLPAGALLKSPVWARFEISLMDGQLPRSTISRFKDMKRRIRKNGFTARWSREKKDLEDFYHGMYLPTTMLRHGNSAVPRTLDELQKILASKGELTFIEMNGKTVAGGLGDYSGDTCAMICNGVRDGSPEYQRLGAAYALYYFEMNRMIECGQIKHIDFGHCRAFFNDGVFRHKVELGAVVKGHLADAGCLFFQFLKRSPALDSFLTRQPFLVLEKDGYVGAVFVDSRPDAVSADEVIEGLGCRGVDTFHLYTFQDVQEVSFGTPSGRRVRLRAFQKLLKEK